MNDFLVNHYKSKKKKKRFYKIFNSFIFIYLNMS